MRRFPRVSPLRLSDACATVTLMQPDYIGTVEAAKLLGTTRRTIQRMVKDGRLTPAFVAPGSHAGTYLFDRAEIERLAA